MERRDLLRFAASLGAGSVSTLLSKGEAAQASVRYEVYGRGPALFLGSPISAAAVAQVMIPSRPSARDISTDSPIDIKSS